MINTKVTKGAPSQDSEEKMFKLLESMDWKLWEIMNMLKDNLPEKAKAAAPAKTSKAKKTEE
jgi:hypothetical protein